MATLTESLRSIEVIQEDIDEAVACNSSRCVVATALARSLPEATHISVDIQTVRYSRPRERKRYVFLTPRSVQEYIIAFDAGDKIDPFRFSLRKPQIVPMAPWAGPNPTKLFVNNDDAARPDKEGGKTPPRAPVHTHMRVFGLRKMRVNQQMAPVIAPG